MSHCVNDDFADYIQYWRHNGYWLFDSPAIIKGVAQDNSISLAGTMLFYYEVYGEQFDGEKWNSFGPEPSFPTNVISPREKKLEGFDVVNFTAGTSPECSGLSCSSLAQELHTNSHCLFDAFEEARERLEDGAFNMSEPGPYRIFAVHSLIGKSDPPVFQNLCGPAPQRLKAQSVLIFYGPA